MLRFPFKEIPSYVCESTCVYVCVSECVRACIHASGVGVGVGCRRGVALEPFQLLMHYRQIGPQIGLFAVD